MCARILVVSDSTDDAEQILEHLSPEFPETRLSTDAAKSLEDFHLFLPDVLLLAFDSLQRAQGYVLSLYLGNQGLSLHRHRNILLCDKADVRAAFELCKKGAFDDYVLYWPQAQDGVRLLMSVWNAARQTIEASAGLSHIDLIAHVKQLGAVQSLLDQHATEAARLSSSARNSLTKAEHVVRAAIDNLGHRLLAEHGATGAQVSVLSRELDRLKDVPLEQAFGPAAMAMDESDTAARQFTNRLVPQLKRLHGIADKVTPSRPVVLMIDDDEFAIKATKKALGGKDYVLVSALSGGEALGLLRRVRPDVILMDVNLPDIDGVSLTRLVKSVGDLAAIPVLMLTGEANRDTLQSSMLAGSVAIAR